MSATTFDTLGYFEKLKAAGMPEAQAKVMIEIQADSVKDFVASRELATKSDLAEIRLEMKGMGMELRVEMQAMKNELIKWMMGGFIAFGAFLFAAMAFLK